MVQAYASASAAADTKIVQLKISNVTRDDDKMSSKAGFSFFLDRARVMKLITWVRGVIGS